MQMGLWGLGKAGRAGFAILCSAAAITAAAAEVRTTTSTRAYTVGGSTASGLVSYMRSHPFAGDYGDAVANIRPRYDLSVATATTKSGCRASKVTLKVHFTITLPRARSTSGMAASTRSAWNAFAAYARQHEDVHKRIYIQCANNFVAKAQRVTGPSCAAVQASVRRLLEAGKRACETRSRAYDHSERKRVAGMSLFRMASSRGKR